VGPGWPARAGRHGRRIPCRQGTARPTLDPCRDGREPRPGGMAAVDRQPHDRGRRHGHRAHRRSPGPSPADPVRHRRQPRHQPGGRHSSLERSAGGAARRRRIGLHLCRGGDPAPAGAHRRAARPAPRPRLLVDLHADRCGPDDAGGGADLARPVVALGVVARGGCLGRNAARVAGAHAATVRARPGSGPPTSDIGRDGRGRDERSPFASAPIPAAGSPSSASCRPCRSSGWVSAPKPPPSSPRQSPS